MGKYIDINRERNEAVPAYLKETTPISNQVYREWYENAFREKLQQLCSEVEEQHPRIVLEKIKVVRRPETRYNWRNLIHFLEYKKVKAKTPKYPFPYMAPETHWEISFKRR